MIAPERIWADPPSLFDGVDLWHEKQDGAELTAVEYIRKDASDAAIASARAEAFIAGANAVHAEWLRAHEAGEAPPRWEPDFSEAAHDYAATEAQP